MFGNISPDGLVVGLAPAALREQLCNRYCSNKHTLCNRYYSNKHTHFGNGDVVVITDSEDEYYEDEYYENEYCLNDATTVWDTTITTEGREALKREQEMEPRDKATQTDPMEFPFVFPPTGKWTK